MLTYDVEAQVGGKIAQLGGRLINGVAKKYADEFFANFSKALAGPEAMRTMAWWVCQVNPLLRWEVPVAPEAT